MIYLVTNNPSYKDCELYTLCTVEQSLKMLEPLKLIGYDSETEGLDCHTHKILSMQFGCEEWQIVVDCRTVDPMNYKDLLESKDKLFLGWNLKFDLKFLFTLHIVPYNMYDGMLAEQLLWLGYPEGMHSMSLKNAGLNYLSVDLDKSIRGQIIWRGLTNEVIEYAANDVRYLEALIKKQREKLQENDLLRAIDIENKFLLPLSYMEWCGIRIDEAKWRAKMANDQIRLDNAVKALDNWLINEFKPGCKGLLPNTDPDVRKLRDRYVFTDLQGDLWSGYNTEPQTSIKWNSPPQVIQILSLFDVDLKTDDKKTGGKKDSIDAKVIGPQKNKCSLIPLLLDYKEAVKVTSTYGENVLRQINPNTGRLHTNFKQLGADTTRITSGGQDRNGQKFINLLNMPSDEETRACFVAKDGNKIIAADFQQEETFLMASISNDQAILKELNEGSGDIHSLTAYIAYPDIIPRNTPIKDIKKLYPEIRQESKGIEFAFNYSGNASTISKNKGIPIEEANRIYNSYMSGFSGLKQYQDFRRKDWWDKGYILLNPITGHKAFIWNYEELKKLQGKFKEPGFWNYYNEMKKEAPDCDTVKTVRCYFEQRSKHERHSVNYGIQATGSFILRKTLIDFFSWIKDLGLLFKVFIPVAPYDEILIEAPKEVSEEVAVSLHRCMLEAGAVFCTRCKLDAEVNRLPDGTLPNYWIH